MEFVFGFEQYSTPAISGFPGTEEPAFFVAVLFGTKIVSIYTRFPENCKSKAILSVLIFVLTDFFCALLSSAWS